MLHTRTHKSRMAIKNERLMSGYTECIDMSGYVIFVHIGMANPALKWPREYPPQLDRRISQVQTREMLNKNK